ncbi:hypothetical protein L1887_43423 [Cichorium endivia]|nr:hypothetical protein L1887_43423 [Cichorium endivia]
MVSAAGAGAAAVSAGATGAPREAALDSSTSAGAGAGTAGAAGAAGAGCDLLLDLPRAAAQLVPVVGVAMGAKAWGGGGLDGLGRLDVVAVGLRSDATAASTDAAEAASTATSASHRSTATTAACRSADVVASGGVRCGGGGRELLDLTFGDADDGVLDVAERFLECKEEVLVGPGGEEFTDHGELIRVFGAKVAHLLGVVPAPVGWSDPWGEGKDPLREAVADIARCTKLRRRAVQGSGEIVERASQQRSSRAASTAADVESRRSCLAKQRGSFLHRLLRACRFLNAEGGCAGAAWLAGRQAGSRRAELPHSLTFSQHSHTHSPAHTLRQRERAFLAFFLFRPLPAARVTRAGVAFGLQRASIQGGARLELKSRPCTSADCKMEAWSADRSPVRCFILLHCGGTNQRPRSEPSIHPLQSCCAMLLRRGQGDLNFTLGERTSGMAEGSHGSGSMAAADVRSKRFLELGNIEWRLVRSGERPACRPDFTLAAPRSSLRPLGASPGSVRED